jgi:ankyrin repeat protein
MSEELITAIRANDLPTVVSLIQAGTPVNGDGAKITPLMWAAQYGHTAIAVYLCASGADVNEVSFAGFTALMDAVLHEHIDIVRLLCARGARTDVLTTIGLSIWQFAKDNEEILEALRADYSI